MRAENAIRRRTWASAMMRRSTEPVPVYGSDEWLALPEGSAAKVAAVVVAAEAWAQDGDDLEDALRLELDLAREGEKAAEDAEYVARAAAHREQWGNLRPCRGAYADLAGARR